MFVAEVENVARAIQGLQGVNASNAIGTPIDPLAVVDAENTVAFLSAAGGFARYSGSCRGTLL
jgi:hypothetical protein